MEEPEKSIITSQTEIGFNAGLAVLNVYGFVKSVAELKDMLQDGTAPSRRVIKALMEADAAAFSVVSSGYYIASAVTEMANTGVTGAAGKASNAAIGELTEKATMLGFVAACCEAAGSAPEIWSLFEEGDTTAGELSAGAQAANLASTGFQWWAARLAVRAGVEATAAATAEGTEAAVGGFVETSFAGAGATSEMPPVAVALVVVSVALFVVSQILEWQAKKHITTKFEKWADRCFLGKHTGGPKKTWGDPFSSMQRQMQALLLLTSLPKIEVVHGFPANGGTVITLPGWNIASSLVFMVSVKGSAPRTYTLTGTDYYYGQEYWSPDGEDIFGHYPRTTVSTADMQMVRKVIAQGGEADSYWMRMGAEIPSGGYYVRVCYLSPKEYPGADIVIPNGLTILVSTSYYNNDLDFSVLKTLSAEVDVTQLIYNIDQVNYPHFSMSTTDIDAAKEDED